MKIMGNTGQLSLTVKTPGVEELGFDPTLIEQNLSLSFSDRIKQASQASNALLKLQAAARNRPVRSRPGGGPGVVGRPPGPTHDPGTVRTWVRFLRKLIPTLSHAPPQTSESHF